MASFWVDKKVLLFGGTGFVGSHLYDRLMDLGANVAGFIHDREEYFITEFRGDVVNYEDVRRAVGRFNPDIIFNLAAQPIVTNKNHKDTLDTNIVGTYNILLASHEFGAQVFQMTTDKVYGETKDEGSYELDPLNGVGHPYDASKVCQDVLAQMFGNFFKVNTVILRSGNIYGEGDYHYDRLIPYLCKQISTEQPIKLRSNGTLRRDYIYVEDVVDAMIGLMEHHYIDPQMLTTRHLHIYNIGAERAYAVFEIWDKLVDIAGKTPHAKFEDKAYNELNYQHIFYDKIKSAIGWTPKTTIEEGLKKTYEWYKERNSGSECLS